MMVFKENGGEGKAPLRRDPRRAEIVGNFSPLREGSCALYVEVNTRCVNVHNERRFILSKLRRVRMMESRRWEHFNYLT